MTSPASPALSGLAGLIASMLSVILLYPLDQAGVVSQASGEHANVFLLLFTDDLFRGLASQLQATGLSYFVYFGAYTSLKLRFRTPRLPQSLADLFAASTAGMLGVLLSNPLWVATTRLKIGKASGAGLWEEIAVICVEEGPGALWNGVSSSMLLVANPAIQFVMYDLLKRNFCKDPTPSALEAFLCGAVAKSFATCTTYPLQVAQTRQRIHRHTHGESDMGIMDCLLEVIVISGFTALYAGIEAKLLQTVLNSALMFMFFEKLLAALNHLSAWRQRRVKRSSRMAHVN